MVTLAAVNHFVEAFARDWDHSRRCRPGNRSRGCPGRLISAITTRSASIVGVDIADQRPLHGPQPFTTCGRTRRSGRVGSDGAMPLPLSLREIATIRIVAVEVCESRGERVVPHRLRLAFAHSSLGGEYDNGQAGFDRRCRPALW